MGEGPLRVGYALPAKKLAKQRMEGFIQYAQSHGVEMHAISLDDDIDAQGPFDLLLHKVTDLMVADKGDARAASQLQALKRYVDAHPSLPVLDPLASVWTLTDRFATLDCLRQVSMRAGTFSVPQTIAARSVEELAHAGRTLSFPVLVKNRPACGLEASHLIEFVPSPEYLEWKGDEVLVQEMVDHEPAVMWKGYVINGHLSLTARTSISSASMMDAASITKLDTTMVSKSHADVPMLDDATIKLIVAAMESLSEELHLTLFGFDVILERNTGRLFVVDVNFFPAYDGIDDFYENLLGLIKERAVKEKSA